MTTIKDVFDGLARGDNSALITLSKQKIDEFKAMSYEERYQTLLKLVVKLGDPGITGDVEHLDRMTQDNVKKGMTSYFNEDEFDSIKKALLAEGAKNPSNDDIIMRLRTDYRGEAPTSDEPLKLTLLYDICRTDGWPVTPEKNLISLDVPEGTDEDLIKMMDIALVSNFGKPNPPAM